jgi:hypothetical protein
MRTMRSQHTFDVVPAQATELSVMDCLAERSGDPRGQVLAIGDSGSSLGNDREMLLRPHAISVDRVCGRHNGSWTLFGSQLRGPDALLRILGAISIEGGSASINLAALGLP